MKLFFVAGESSGDMHSASLIHALRVQAPEVQCEGLGGRMMEAAGMTLHYDLAGDAIMGFSEVVKHFLPIRRLFLDTVQRLRQNPPDALVLIDYPGFNIRLAKEAHALKIPVIYYISPQVWAWKKKRIHTLRKLVDLMLVIFPFEEPLYEKVGLRCRYVGHPLVERIDGDRRGRRDAPARPAPSPGEEGCGEGDAQRSGATGEAMASGSFIIGLLPGSRAQEIERLLTPMLDTARGILQHYPQARFVTPVVNERRAELVRRLAGDFPLEVKIGGMYDVLSAARFCMVASGTATLETALFGVPLVLLYRVTPVTYWLARLVIDIEHIGIVNILARKRVVPEFIQHEATAANILPVALDLIADTPARARMIQDLESVRELLGGGGASECAANEIVTFLKGASTG